MGLTFFNLLTPVTYWVLIAMWSFILYFYLRRVRTDWHQNSLMLILFIILTIDAFRTLFESFYFGAWYTARAGLLPMGIHDFLVQPQMVIIPKLLNVFAAGLIIAILFRCWLPREGEEIKRLETTILIRTRELLGTIEKLETEMAHRVLTEDALKKSEAKYADLFENSPDMYALVNLKTALIEDCNMTLAKALGYSKEEIIGWPVIKIYPPDAVEEAKNAFKLFMKTGEIHNKDLQLQRKDGLKIVAGLNVSSVRDKEGHMIYSRITLRDITARKRVEALTQARLKMLETAQTPGLTLEDLLQRMLDEIEALTKSTVGFYHFMEDDQQTLSMQSWSTHTLSSMCTAEGKGRHYPVAEAGIWADCVRERRPVIHNDYASLPNHRGIPEGHAPVVRELVVPILRDSRIVAVIGMGNKPEAYNDNDIQVVSFLGDFSWEIVTRKQMEKEIQNMNRELESRVAERTSQLEATNRELEAFAYSVSHDLRAPLRHIDGFLGLLHEKLETALDEQGRHYMEAVSKAARKMGLLIDNLLNFSRMGRHTISFQPVAPGDLVRDIIRDLEPDAAGRTIEWHIDDLPKVYGDVAMLRMALNNLISNALKFTRPRHQARIDIGSVPGQTSEAVIYVRDNGVGFDMTYADKLFGVFQRLHRADEFEGTGIGLANVHRIITRHGGRVWAEGEIDQGAVFYFSLPQKQQGGNHATH
ncbi:MAG: GAF domain-containing protein [Desulfobacula sp.]|jgi:PAS domain S-box-containing protein